MKENSTRNSYANIGKFGMLNSNSSLINNKLFGRDS